MLQILSSQSVSIVIASMLISGLVATVVSHLLYRRFAAYSVKRDVLRRFVGNRFILTQSHPNYSGEPFVALNEIFVVYADDTNVISALKKLHADREYDHRFEDNLVALIKTMAKAARVELRQLNDYFLMHPFVPRTND